MIEKMNFLSITGPKADIDRVVNTYLCKYEIHLENALSELTTVESLTPFLDVNPYRDALNSINTIYEELKTPPSTSNRSPGIETALSTVKEIRSQADQLQKEQSELEEKCSSLAESLRIIRPFRNIDCPFRFRTFCEVAILVDGNIFPVRQLVVNVFYIHPAILGYTIDYHFRSESFTCRTVITCPPADVVIGTAVQSRNIRYLFSHLIVA